MVFGGQRHLALAAPLIRGEAVAWPSPFSVAPVIARRGERVCVLASGDPFCHGVGTTLSPHLAPEEFRAFPAPSAFSLAAAWLGWGLPETDCLSLHGKPIAGIRPHLHPGRRLLVLTSDDHGPAQLAALLTGWGFGPSRLTVLEALGGPRQRVQTTTAESFDLSGLNPLNVLAVEVAAAPGAAVLPRAPGLPEALFDHDGQITKHEVRALTLSALAPRRGQRLWDIGAGSGSVAIEWLLADPSLSAIAIEAQPERAARCAANAQALGVPHLAVIEGRAPEVLSTLPAPDAVFIGGGATVPGVVEAAQTALPPGGRLVLNAVTLESEALCATLHARHGGTLLRLELARAAPLGGMTAWRPALPIVQWTWIKP